MQKTQYADAIMYARRPPCGAEAIQRDMDSGPWGQSAARPLETRQAAGGVQSIRARTHNSSPYLDLVPVLALHAAAVNYAVLGSHCRSGGHDGGIVRAGVLGILAAVTIRCSLGLMCARTLGCSCRPRLSPLRRDGSARPCVWDQWAASTAYERSSWVF